jgi:hypothetical protein
VDSDNVPHILVTVLQNAGYEMYDCVYEKDTRRFLKSAVYEAPGINLQAVSE